MKIGTKGCIVFISKIRKKLKSLNREGYISYLLVFNMLLNIIWVKQGKNKRKMCTYTSQRHLRCAFTFFSDTFLSTAAYSHNNINMNCVPLAHRNKPRTTKIASKTFRYLYEYFSVFPTFTII